MSSSNSLDHTSSDSTRLLQLFDPSAAHLIQLVAERTVAAIIHSWREGREAQIVITGGRTGLAIAKGIDLALFRATSDDESFKGSTVRVWFSDERFLGHDDPERSDSLLMAGFERSSRYIHFERVAEPSAGTLEAAAESYANELDSKVGESARFDAVILSMGEDGHIASLFPGHTSELNSMKSAVAVDNSPKPPAQRVSIGVARLAKASAIYIFAVGEGKREALDELLTGNQVGNEATPISLLRKNAPHSSLFIVTDLKF